MASEYFQVLKNNFPQINEQLLDKIDVAFTIIGEKGVGYIQDVTPIDSGTLAGSISYKLGVEFGSPYIMFYTDVRYAPYQELGTSRMPAANRGKGFFRWPIEKQSKEFQHIITSELSDLSR